MIAYTRWVQEAFTESPMTEEYRRAGTAGHFDATYALTRLAIVAGDGEILGHYSGGSSGGGTVNMHTPGAIQIHLYYFPGWKVTVNGLTVPVRPSPPHGLLEIDVPAGEHHIMARMGSTPPRAAGAVISWVTLAVLLASWGWSYWRNQRPIGE
jgi:hypothetical protein